jgi:nucleoside 2-deoxyribosyltransferase
MKLYIAGPMSGYPDLNFPEFRRAAEIIKAEGLTALSPLDLDLNKDAVDTGGADRHIFLREDFRLLLEADGILLLDGWLESVGANAELAVARMTGQSVWRLIGKEIHLSGAHPRVDLLTQAMEQPYFGAYV